MIGFIVTLVAAPENVKNVAITSDEMNILADIAVIDRIEIILTTIASNIQEKYLP